MKMIATLVGITLLSGLMCHADEPYSVESKYGTVIIPHLAITNATLMHAIAMLIDACGQSSPTGTAPGVRVDPRGLTPTQINLVTNNILVLEAYRAVAAQAGLDMRIGKWGIVFEPKKIETRKVEPRASGDGVPGGHPAPDR